jgi:hypothetical protein
MMKAKNYFIISIAVLAAAISVMGCSGKKQAESTENALGTQPLQEAASIANNNAPGRGGKSFNIGVSMYKTNNAFMSLYQAELQKELENAGFQQENILLRDANGKSEEQAKQMSEFINSAVDAIVINPVKPAEVQNYVNQARSAGIPIIIINRETSHAEEARWATEGIRASYVGNDAQQAGNLLGEIVVSLDNKGDINGDGTVSYLLLQGDADIAETGLKGDYCAKAITEAGLGKEELLKTGVNFDRAAAKQAVSDAVAKFGDKLEVVFCADDETALGAVEGAEAAGKKPGENIYILGINGIEEACKEVKAGRLTGTLYADYKLQAQLAAKAAMDMINKKAVEALDTVDYTKVTKDNAGEILEKLEN